MGLLIRKSDMVPALKHWAIVRKYRIALALKRWAIVMDCGRDRCFFGRGNGFVTSPPFRLCYGGNEETWGRKNAERPTRLRKAMTWQAPNAQYRMQRDGV